MAAQATAATTADVSLQAQAAIAAQAARLLPHAWAEVDPANLDATLPQLKLLVAAILRRYGQAAAAAAERFYAQRRIAAGITGRYRPVLADPPSMEHVSQVVDYASGPLWGTPDLPAAQARLDAAVQRLVLDAGRSTIVDTANADREAKGWARVPEPTACSFCAMLATRGAVYKRDTVDFQAHDHCQCHAEPVFNSYEPSALIREWQALYRATPYGANAKEARANFRRAYDAKYGGNAGTAQQPA